MNNILEQLPIEFIDFLKQEQIDQQQLLTQPNLRYIRVKDPQQITFQYLQNIFPRVQKISWLEGMYSIPLNEKISNQELYKSGQIYGIDLSSASVVHSLGINSNDQRVLEICCAPGAKLCYIADMMRALPSDKERKVVGIDINENRLNITRSMISKYKLQSLVELVQADGTKYENQIKFDKILIDAECTHEGSIKHLQKFTHKVENKKEIKKKKQSQKQLKKNHTNEYISEWNKSNDWSAEDFKQRFLDPLKLNNLTNLQSQLLCQGWKNLKDGGILVYSTCSFSKKQNEDIVQDFIEKVGHDKAELIHPFSHLSEEEISLIPFRQGSLENTVRFDPLTSQTGGMFIAKFLKK